MAAGGSPTSTAPGRTRWSDPLSGCRACEGADPAALLDALESARSGATGVRVSGRNSDLHEEIVKLADHHLLLRMTGLMNGRVRWLFCLTPERDTPKMWQEHAELVQAIVGGQRPISHPHSGSAILVKLLLQRIGM